jgi:hypothetical protein
MKKLTDAGFRGEVRTVYGPKGPKHAHISLYLDLEQIDPEELGLTLYRLGCEFREAAQ